MKNNRKNMKITVKSDKNVLKKVKKHVSKSDNHVFTKA